MHMTKRELQDLYWIKKHIQRMKEKLEDLRAQADPFHVLRKEQDYEKG